VTIVPEIKIEPTIEALAGKGAEIFVTAARSAIAKRGRFTAALSGGSSPAPLFRRLGEIFAATGIDTQTVHIFWADERCVPPGNEESNFRLANELFLSRLPPPGPAVHRIKGELGPDEAARAYEIELAEMFPGEPVPEMDLILLGIGADGHTASILPGFDPRWHRGHSAVPVHVKGKGVSRVTLALPVINAARQLVFFVTGAAKASITAEIISGKGNISYPAALVSPRFGNMTWLLDGAAAASLAGTPEPSTAGSTH
jgi:6-phosphogluconolactonase